MHAWALLLLHCIRWPHAQQWEVRLLCAGKLRTTILHFYAQTSDHVKRLSSVAANGKFSAADSGMDAPLARPEAMASVVATLRVSAQFTPSQHCKILCHGKPAREHSIGTRLRMRKYVLVFFRSGLPSQVLYLYFGVGLAAAYACAAKEKVCGMQ